MQPRLLTTLLSFLLTNRHYPLHRAASFITTYPYRIGEPGFDAYQANNPHANYTYDPNHALPGEPEVDYSIEVRCLAISPGLRAVHKEHPQFTIDDVNEGFSHSNVHWMRNDPHMHMSYQADSGDELRWITWQIRDVLDDGHSLNASRPFTLVFNKDPDPGDLLVDGVVDQYDLVILTQQWNKSNAGPENDYCERADANRDGTVNYLDFDLLRAKWHPPMNDPNSNPNLSADLNGDGVENSLDFALIGLEWKGQD